jgi:hypothetical protein
MTAPSRQLVIAVICVFCWASLCQGQAGPPLSTGAAKVRAKITSLSPGTKLTVLMKNKEEYHGDLQESDQQSFSLYGVDEKQNLVIQYEDVKKVRLGYGGYNSVSGRHVDPFRSHIAVIAVVASLVVIVALIASAKD